MKLQFKFLPIPEELMRSKAISWGAKFLFGIIAKANLDGVRMSNKHLAERMNCTVRQVQRRVAELRDNGFIIVKRTGRSNVYFVNFELVQIIQTDDKNVVSDMTSDVVSDMTHDVVSTIKNNSKRTSLNNMSQSDTPFDLKEYLEKMKKDKRRAIQIIALWIEQKGLKPETYKQMESIIKRNLRPAQLLVGYKDEDIIETIKVIKNTDWIKKFTLETVLKFIDETISMRKKEKKIVKLKRVIIDGKPIVKIIYAKN